MTFPVHLLHGRVVGVFVRNEESRLNVATVGVLALAIEHFLVQFYVVVVDGIVEGDRDHLRDVLGGEVPGDGGAVFGAEAVRKDADGRVAWGRSVRVVFNIWRNK